MSDRANNIIRRILKPVSVVFLAVLMIGIFISAKQIQAATYDRPMAVAKTQNYKINGNSSNAEISFNLTLYGGISESDLLQLGRDKIKNPRGDSLTARYFFVGLALFNETREDWACNASSQYGSDEARVIDGSGCRFIATSQIFSTHTADQSIVINFNPSQISSSVPSGSPIFHNFKLVPVVYSFDSFVAGPGAPPTLSTNYHVFDSSNLSFYVEWDNSLTSPPQVISNNSQQVSTGSLSGTAINVATPDAPDLIGGAIGQAVTLIMTVILGIVRGLLQFLFAIILVPTLDALLADNGSFVASSIPSVIQEMWIYVRDIMNLLFILVLIFTGIVVMLRVSGYQLRTTVARIIVIALVVNFSLLIGQIILNFAQILLNEFIGPNTIEQVRRGIDIFGVGGKMGRYWTLSASEQARNVMMLLFAVVYEIGMFVVLAAFGMFLLIRLVGVWLLLVIAPIAYVLYITEFGRKYFSQWWYKFLSYAFFAPIIAFFLALAAKFVSSPSFMAIQLPTDRSHIVNANPEFADAIIGGMQGVLVLAILVFGLNIARKMGIAGADMVVGQAQRLWKGAVKGGMTFIPRAVGGTVKAGGSAISRYGTKMGGKRGTALGVIGKGVGITGSAFKQFGTAPAIAKPLYGSMAATAKANLARDARMSAATVESALAKTPIIGAVFRGLGAKQGVKESAIRAQIAEKLKDIPADNAEELVTGFKREIAAGRGYEAAAYMIKLAANGDLGALASAYGKANHAFGLQAIVDEQLVPLIGKESAYALGHDISMTAEKANHYNYGRAYKAIEKDGKFEYQRNENALRDAFKVHIKKEPQKIATNASRDGWGFIEAKDEKGEKTVDYGWSAEGREFFRSLPANTQLSSRVPYDVLGTGMLKNAYTAFLDNKELALQFADRMAGLDENQLRTLKENVTKSVDGDELDQLQQFNMETIHALLTGEDVEGNAIDREVKILQPKVDKETGAVTKDHDDQPFQKLLTPDDLKRAPQLRKAYTEWHLEKFGTRPAILSAPTLSTESAQSIARDLHLKRDIINELEETARVLHTGANDLSKAIDNMTSKLSAKNISLDASTVDKIKSELLNKTVQAKIKGAERIFDSLGSVPPGLRLRAEKAAAEELEAQLSEGGVKLGDPILTNKLAKRLTQELKGIPKAQEVAKVLAQALNKKEKPNWA